MRAEVRRVVDLTTWMRRLVLGGDDLRHLVWSGAASHLKLILPAPGRGPDVLPPAGALQPALLDRDALTVRTYTPRAWDPLAGELSVDVLVHADGPASDWAARAAPGDPLAVTTPLGRYDVDPAADWLVLAGDESALPAIATILEITPPGLPTTVVAEVPGDDGPDLGAGPSVEVRWIRRRGPAGSGLEAVLSDATPAGAAHGSGVLPPAGDGRVWVACEAHAMLRLRRHLLEVRGLARGSITTRGYWTSGRNDDPTTDGSDATGGVAPGTARSSSDTDRTD